MVVNSLYPCSYDVLLFNLQQDYKEIHQKNRESTTPFYSLANISLKRLDNSFDYDESWYEFKTNSKPSKSVYSLFLSRIRTYADYLRNKILQIMQKKLPLQKII